MKKFFTDLGHFFKDLFYVPFTKKSGRLAILYMLFAAALVGANCVAAKQIPIDFGCGFLWFGKYSVSITAGILFYPFTFLITDIIGENYGRKAANKAVLGGFIGQVAVILIILLIDAINGSNQEAFHAVFGSVPLITIGSLLACIVSQTWDVFIFHKLRDRYIRKHGSTKGGKWIWNNASTIGSQFIDSIIFQAMLFAALGLWGVPDAAGTFFATLLVYWGLKVIIALLDTPIFYLLTMGHKDRMSITSDHESDVSVL